MSKILELAKRIASTGGLETKTTETISGTYDSAGQQRLLSHAYTIGADLTITNGELILSRLADNGTGMTVEFGSDITLSGDGTLMLGDLGQGQPNQDFSASKITGTLPSTVFPASHILQVQGNSTARVTNSGQNTTVISQKIVIQDYANNDILIVATGVTCKTSAGGTGAHFGLYVCGGSLGATTSGALYPQQIHYLLGTGDEETIGISHWDKAPPSANETYSLYLLQGNSAVISHMQWTIAVYEIKR